MAKICNWPVLGNLTHICLWTIAQKSDYVLFSYFKFCSIGFVGYLWKKENRQSENLGDLWADVYWRPIYWLSAGDAIASLKRLNVFRLPDLDLHPGLWPLEAWFFWTLVPSSFPSGVARPVGGENHDVVRVLPLLHCLHLPACLCCPLLPGRKKNLFEMFPPTCWSCGAQKVILERPLMVFFFGCKDIWDMRHSRVLLKGL